MVFKSNQFLTDQDGIFTVICELFASASYEKNSQLEAMRQKSSCSLVMSKAECRDSGSILSLESAAVERLGLEAWRRVEAMQLGTCHKAAGLQRGPINTHLYRTVACLIYLQRCFDIFVVVLGAPFLWKSPLFLGAVKCRCLEGGLIKKNSQGKQSIFSTKGREDGKNSAERNDKRGTRTGNLT